MAKVNLVCMRPERITSRRLAGQFQPPDLRKCDSDDVSTAAIHQSDSESGSAGLEPGTNPESFRGCSHEFNAKIASLGFFFFFNSASSARASVIEGICFDATSLTFTKRRVV